MTSLRGWPVWSIRRSALVFLLGSEVIAAAATALLLVHEAVTTTTLVRVATLAGLSIGYSEVAAHSTRMQRYLGSGKLFSNPMSVWSYAAVLTVPAGWAAAFIAIQYTHAMWQRRRDKTGHPHRVLFTAAATMLAQLAAAGLVDFGGHEPGLQGNTQSSLAALAGVLVFLAVNMTVLLTGMWLSARPPSIRAMIPDRDTLSYELATLVLGIATAEFVLHSPVLTPAALVLVAFVHRSSVVKALQRSVRTDSKTGLLTSAAWADTTRAILSRARRAGGNVTVLLLDLDHFKRVNDAHGHLTGDRVLTAVADALRSELRGHDGIGRFGGEEFVVVLDGPDAVTAAAIAGRLCSAVRAVRIDGETVRVTASIGLAHQRLSARAHDSAPSVEMLLGRADAALYQAKQAGRDQVHIARPATLGPANPPHH